MNYKKLILSCWLILTFCASAAAYDIQKGIHGMDWGSSKSEHKDLDKVHQTGQAAFYINSTMGYQTAKQPIPGVFYGFYRDQLFAVFIKLRSPDQFSHLERQLRAKHGNPKTNYNAESGQTVYRWKDGDVKIKLKMRESPSEYKLALYYSPLSERLNQEQLEQMPDDVFKTASPGKEKTVYSAPLLD